jgi:hypothetical protein
MSRAPGHASVRSEREERSRRRGARGRAARGTHGSRAALVRYEFVFRSPPGRRRMPRNGMGRLVRTSSRYGPVGCRAELAARNCVKTQDRGSLCRCLGSNYGVFWWPPWPSAHVWGWHGGFSTRRQGYSESKFNSLHAGMTPEEVEAVMGAPLKKILWENGSVNWTYSDRP